MNKLMVPAVIAATAWTVGIASSQEPPRGPTFQPSPYFQMPLEKDASRVVRMQSVVQTSAHAANASPPLASPARTLSRKLMTAARSDL